MDSFNSKKNWLNEIMTKCIECGCCSSECILLEETGEEPASIAARGIQANVAFSCSLCYLCESLCPLE